MEADYSVEAIPERDPDYVLPPDPEDSEPERTMTLAEAHHWDAMVEQRPQLRCLRINP
jgi:hypothetical protein